ncbi:MACPF domain-containing protein [Sesamum alatum]|uniref:MACPF domain-containing protein n=1 Tax=Sesamum alatum TaxID=300844 RepID=A0AAE1XRC6_9LAMI|nr:MACPF domain-containing protein [Sesamum alatum]
MADNGGGIEKETALRLKARARARAAAEEAVQCIGLGYDLTMDLSFKYCKKQQQTSKDGSRLIAVDVNQVRNIAFPGGFVVKDVPKSISCDKGERMRFSSDVLSFQQMSEQFNQELSLSGKIPTGHFNAAFEFTACWQKDAAFTKSLAFDGVFISLYNIALEKSQVTLGDHIKHAVPTSWDPAALARFIEKYGTHVIVGVKMGGKDIIYVKQQQSSPLKPIELQNRLKDVADKKFSDHESNEGGYAFLGPSTPSSHSNQEEVTFFWRRIGGSSSRNMSHTKWCQTVPLEPEPISMSFIPISSLLSGVDGSGFLGHAINLYMRYKPPIEALPHFLGFQIPRQWAPLLGDVPVGPDRKQQGAATLQFSLMGSKLYVNTDKVNSTRFNFGSFKSNLLVVHAIMDENDAASSSLEK